MKLPEGWKPGITRDDIEPCVMCGEGVAHSNQIQFYRVTIESHVLDARAIQRETGLEMMLGHPAVAAVLSPDSHFSATLIDGNPTVLVCQECALMMDAGIGSILSKVEDRQ